MDRVEIVNSKLKVIASLALAITLDLGCIYMFWAGGWHEKLFGSIGALLFTYFAYVSVKGLLDDSPQIVLDDEGIVITGSGIEKIFWADIKSASIIKSERDSKGNTRKLIMLEIENPQKYPSKISGSVLFSAPLLHGNQFRFDTDNLKISKKQLLGLINERLLNHPQKSNKL